MKPYSHAINQFLSACLLVAAGLMTHGPVLAGEVTGDESGLPSWELARLCDQPSQSAGLALRDRDVMGVWRQVRNRLFPSRDKPASMHPDDMRQSPPNSLRWGVRIRHDRVMLSLEARW